MVKISDYYVETDCTVCGIKIIVESENANKNNVDICDKCFKIKYGVSDEELLNAIKTIREL